MRCCSPPREYDQERGVRIEISVPAGAIGAAFVKRCFSELENAVNTARASRQGALVRCDFNDRGSSRGLMVHKLPRGEARERDLPEATLKLLDSNILNFVGKIRASFASLGSSTRKGILLYGPPGTGKTLHDPLILASNLPGHTTLIITGGASRAARRLDGLARLLQPVMVVIEDVDLSRELAKGWEDLGRIVAQQATQRDGWTERGLPISCSCSRPTAGAA